MFLKRDIQFGVVLLALASVVGFSCSWLVGLAVVAVALVVAISTKKSFVVFVCLLGVFRGWAEPMTDVPATPVHISGIIGTDPVENGELRFSMRTDIGLFDVRSYNGPEILFGDQVVVTCQTIERTSRFHNPRCRASAISVLGHLRGPQYLHALHGLASFLTAGVKKSFPSPEAPLLSGILLGSRNALPDELADAFRRTGTSHIIAVSGYNVTIVIALIATVLGRMRLPRRELTWLTMLAIVGFVLLTGASASVVRAGIMGGLVVLARSVGRLSDGLHALIISASVMVIVHPQTIADVGFQLSVAATAGLILLAEPFEQWLHWLPKHLSIRTSLATTLAAIILTEPIIVLTFGRTSLIAPLVNLFVLPLVPISMALGFFVAVVAAVAPVTAVFIGWFAWLPLTLIVRIVSLAADLPFASISIPPAASVVVASAFSLFIVLMLVRRKRSYHVNS